MTGNFLEFAAHTSAKQLGRLASVAEQVRKSYKITTQDGKKEKDPKNIRLEECKEGRSTLFLPENSGLEMIADPWMVVGLGHSYMHLVAQGKNPYELSVCWGETTNEFFPTMGTYPAEGVRSMELIKAESGLYTTRVAGVTSIHTMSAGATLGVTIDRPAQPEPKP
ncbi:MAG: hypothetical protein OXR66_00440 [Candidatus Woesearchaeota archaeon]|nr:hypothetical protein [Candidatus Woesearchaeota archaeon]